jgi:hypothetical protein
MGRFMPQEEDRKYHDLKNLCEATMVSFDLPLDDASRRSIVQRFLHGRVERRVVNGGEKTYHYPGLLEEGGFRVGQSVYLLPADLASRLIVKLREMMIEHRYWDVTIRG